MRWWITTVMLVTFLSGGTSGFVIGRASAPEPKEPTAVDRLVDELERAGVTREADLAKAREIYGRWLERVRALKGEVEKLFEARLTALAMDAEGQIQEILDTYPDRSGGAKEK